MEQLFMTTDKNIIKPTIILIIATGILLLVPLIAMKFTGDVMWTLSDFIVAGFLLFGTGFMYILVTRIAAATAANNIIFRIAVGIALFSGLFLVWSNLAVGLIGSEDNPANLMYFGVVAVGIIGALAARFRPKGLAKTMFAMASTQALIAVIIMAGGMHQSAMNPLPELIMVNGFFIFLFIVSALLFRYFIYVQAEDYDKPEGGV